MKTEITITVVATQEILIEIEHEPHDNPLHYPFTCLDSREIQEIALKRMSEMKPWDEVWTVKGVTNEETGDYQERALIGRGP